MAYRGDVFQRGVLARSVRPSTLGCECELIMGPRQRSVSGKKGVGGAMA